MPRSHAPSMAAVLFVLLTAGCGTTPAPPGPPPELAAVVAGPQRGADSRALDRYRHPLETLEFFGVQPDITVVEIWPGAGWYTEILAPYLRDHGRYYAAGFVPAADREDAPPKDDRGRTQAAFAAKLKATPAVYDRVRLTQVGPPSSWTPAPPGSADLVLTFQDVHHWLADDTVREMFAAFHRTLKPGGVLGVVEHRAAPGTSLAKMKASGYVTQDLVVTLAEQAGFRFAAWEEINAHPKDTRDRPRGVWTLPPTLALGTQDREHYLEIGEPDRMTLKFIKPPA